MAKVGLILIVSGGKVVMPRNSSENDRMAALALTFYDMCEASEQSGKTAWIGMYAELGQDNWKVVPP